MSEETQKQDEVVANPIEDLVNQITTGELNKAEGSFNSIIQDKVHSALEAEKVAVAGNYHNDEPVDDIIDEEILDELDDEEVVSDELDGEIEEEEPSEDS